ncbi:MAG: hypothetical protein LBQ88_06895 [Treponema sp.]|jgi:hypothetical protein|nr:hypothetical protein [Treponema sp.]
MAFIPIPAAEFINEPVDKRRKAHGVEFTGGRPARKNDNCYVEQKNYAAVRKVVGYARYEEDGGLAACCACGFFAYSCKKSRSMHVFGVCKV